jgi:hypothetical protein
MVRMQALLVLGIHLPKQEFAALRWGISEITNCVNCLPLHSSKSVNAPVGLSLGFFENIVCSCLHVADCDLSPPVQCGWTLRCFCCCNTSCHITTKTPRPLGLVVASGFHKVVLSIHETLTAQCKYVLFYLKFKHAEK